VTCVGVDIGTFNWVSMAIICRRGKAIKHKKGFTIPDIIEYQLFAKTLNRHWLRFKAYLEVLTNRILENERAKVDLF
jgi:hypothetical protein